MKTECFVGITNWESKCFVKPTSSTQTHSCGVKLFNIADFVDYIRLIIKLVEEAKETTVSCILCSYNENKSHN